MIDQSEWSIQQHWVININKQLVPDIVLFSQFQYNESYRRETVYFFLSDGKWVRTPHQN